MAFEVGDEVVYEGSLGKHAGTVTAVSENGSVDVSVPGLPDRLRTDADSLTCLVPASVGEPGSGTVVPQFAVGGVIMPGATTQMEA